MEKLVSGIRDIIPAVLRIRIRNSVPFRPLDPGWVKNLHSDPGIRIRDEHILDHISGSLLRNNFWVKKILKSFYADSESGIFLSLDPG
jgi:hypothetical protein